MTHIDVDDGNSTPDQERGERIESNSQKNVLSLTDFAAPDPS
jgi:hypothetical protein